MNVSLAVDWPDWLALKVILADNLSVAQAQE
jgi:hypothetical protein